MMGNAGMVSNLDQIQSVDDKNLLSGHILVLLGQDYDAAQASLFEHVLRAEKVISICEDSHVLTRNLHHCDVMCMRCDVYAM